MKDIYGNVVCQYEVGDTASFKSGVNPNTLYKGTTWIKLEGLTVVGHKANDSDFGTVGKTLGSKTHKLTIPESPSHEHAQLEMWTPKDEGAKLITAFNAGVNYGIRWNDTIPTSKVGGDQPHNNIQPSKVCNLWERTA